MQGMQNLDGTGSKKATLCANAPDEIGLTHEGGSDKRDDHAAHDDESTQEEPCLRKAIGQGQQREPCTALVMSTIWD